MNTPLFIGILGKPLSGKDMVARVFRDADSTLATISMGDVLWEVKATGPTHRFWSILKDSIAVAEAGGIAPEEPICVCFGQLMEEKFREGKKTVVWVAGPRNEAELRWIDAWTKERGIAEKFINIEMSDAEAYRRLDGRKEGRADDHADILSVRLDNFEKITKPVIDELRTHGRLVEISGMGDKEAVSRRAIEALHLKFPDPEITLPASARR